MTETTGAERLSEEMALPAPNLPLLRKILDHIDAHPEEWNQGDWVRQTRCGTTYCIAGHAVAMTEGTREDKEYGDLVPAVSDSWEDAGRAALGLTYSEADEMFYQCDSRAEVQAVAERIAARAGEVL